MLNPKKGPALRSPFECRGEGVFPGPSHVISRFGGEDWNLLCSVRSFCFTLALVLSKEPSLHRNHPSSTPTSTGSQFHHVITTYSYVFSSLPECLPQHHEDWSIKTNTCDSSLHGDHTSVSHKKLPHVSHIAPTPSLRCRCSGRTCAL